jgi:hypothetical protein
MAVPACNRNPAWRLSLLFLKASRDSILPSLNVGLTPL